MIYVVKRTRKITFRVTEKEYERIKKKAANTTLKMEPFIRTCLTNKPIEPLPPVNWMDAVRQMSGIANNINQIAHVANISKTVSEESISEIKELLLKCWKCVRY